MRCQRLHEQSQRQDQRHDRQQQVVPPQHAGVAHGQVHAPTAQPVRQVQLRAAAAVATHCGLGVMAGAHGQVVESTNLLTWLPQLNDRRAGCCRAVWRQFPAAGPVCV